MTTTSTDMEFDARQLLASEPKFHRGLDSPMRREASRTITYTWTVGEGDKSKNTDRTVPNERVTFEAVLTIDHHKKGRGAAHYSATLWQHQVADGVTCIAFDGSNGHRVLTDTNGAGRYNANKLGAFAQYALGQLQGSMNTDPKVLAYFKPERV